MVKTYEQLSKEIDEVLSKLSSEELAIELAKYGIKFDKPTLAIQKAMDEYSNKNHE